MNDTLFAEPGARWRAIAYGPAFCLFVLICELLIGGRVHLIALTVGAVLTALIVWVQVIGGRRYVSVELTRPTLRNGPEELAVADIEHIYRERDAESWDDEIWELGRALGELSDVPRGRKPIGLRLRSGANVRTWARDPDGLRAALLVARPDLVTDQTGETA